jgi:hypothetical protein
MRPASFAQLQAKTAPRRQTSLLQNSSHATTHGSTGDGGGPDLVRRDRSDAYRTRRPQSRLHALRSLDPSWAPPFRVVVRPGDRRHFGLAVRGCPRPPCGPSRQHHISHSELPSGSERIKPLRPNRHGWSDGKPVCQRHHIMDVHHNRRRNLQRRQHYYNPTRTNGDHDPAPAPPLPSTQPGDSDNQFALLSNAGPQFAYDRLIESVVPPPTPPVYETFNLYQFFNQGLLWQVHPDTLGGTDPWVIAAVGTTPVPEPTSAGLAVIGPGSVIVCVLVRHRRARRRQAAA